jgi:hypothetical protein
MKKNKYFRQKNAVERFEKTVEKYQHMLKNLKRDDEEYKKVELKLSRMTIALENTIKNMKK